MRILVDEMPKESYDCPHCRDDSTMNYDEYTCMWNGNESKCWGPDECPYFVQMKVYRESSNEN